MRRAAAMLVVAVLAFAAGDFVGDGRGKPDVPPPAAPPTRPRVASRPAPSRTRVEPAPEPPAVEAPPRPEHRPTVRIAVRDEFGAPVVGASTILAAEGVLLSGDAALDRPWPIARTGDDGVAEAAISRDSRARPLCAHCFADGFVPKDFRVGYEEALRDGVEAVLEHAVIVRGRCIDQNGAPLAHVAVRAPRRGPTGATGDDGRFDVAGVSATSGYVRFFPDGRPVAARRVPVAAAHDGVVDLGDVILARGGVVQGRFLDRDGKPVAGARADLVCRELEGFAVGSCRTDADGRFVFEHVGDGTFDVCIVRDDRRLDGPCPGAFAYGVAVGGPDVVVRAPGDHYLRVNYVDEDRRPVGHFSARAAWRPLDGGDDAVSWEGLGNGWTHAHVPVRPGVTYDLRFEFEGFEPATLRVTATDALDQVVDAVFRPKPR